MSKDNKPQKTYRVWTQENLNLAINSVNEGICTSRAASKLYGIPRTTLERRLKLFSQEKKPQRRAPLFGHYEKNYEKFTLNLEVEKLPNLNNYKKSEKLLPQCLEKQIQNVNRCNWTQEQLMQAIESVNNGSSSCRSASKKFGIPRTTLIRHIKEGTSKRKRAGRMPILGALENELKEFLLVEQNKGNIWSMAELRKVAFDFAESHNIKHKFNEEKGLASYDWVHAFTRRHPEIIIETRKRPVPDLIDYNYDFCDLLQIVLEEGEDNSDVFKHINAGNS